MSGIFARFGLMKKKSETDYEDDSKSYENTTDDNLVIELCKIEKIEKLVLMIGIIEIITGLTFLLLLALLGNYRIFPLIMKLLYGIFIIVVGIKALAFRRELKEIIESCSQASLKAFFLDKVPSIVVFSGNLIVCPIILNFIIGIYNIIVK